MRNFKRIMAASIAAICLAGTLLGCDSKKTAGADGVKEYSLFMYKEVEAYSEDMPIWKAAEEKTGIRLKNVISKSTSNAQSAYSTMLAGGNLADIINYSVDDLRILGEDGGLVPLNDLIDKYAPNIKKFFEDYPEAKKYASVNGKIYFIPGSINGMERVPTMGFFIRQDWLDKLGLKTPTTIQEYHDVLLAFRTQDPNGNGKQDEVPYFDRFNGIKNLLTTLYATNNTHFINKDGEYEFGAVTENYKNAIKELSKWYKEGLIDKELYTRKSAREQLLGQNLGGSTIDWFNSTSNFNVSFKDVVPGLNFVGMYPPENIYGENMIFMCSSALHGFGWGISANVDKDSQEDLIKYMDFWMSEEGAKLMGYGIEGVSYTKGDNGEIIWSEEAKAYTSGIPNYLRSIGNQEIGCVVDAFANESSMNEIGKAAYDMYKDQNLLREPMPQLSFTSEETAIINKYNVNIITAVSEQEQKWILGEQDVDATWDSYIATLNKMGLKELEKVYRAAYKRYIEG